jgi:hypothetical protein
MFALGGLHVVVLRGRGFPSVILSVALRGAFLSLSIGTSQANERDIEPRRGEAED